MPPELSSWCEGSIPPLPSTACIPCESAFTQACTEGMEVTLSWNSTEFVPSPKPAHSTPVSRKSILKVNPYIARAVIQGAVCHCTQMGKKCTAQHNRRKITKCLWLLPCSAAWAWWGDRSSTQHISSKHSQSLFLTFPSEDICPCSCSACPEGSNAGGHWFCRMRWSFPAFYRSKSKKSPQNNNALRSLHKQRPNWEHLTKVLHLNLTHCADGFKLCISASCEALENEA